MTQTQEEKKVSEKVMWTEMYSQFNTKILKSIEINRIFETESDMIADPVYDEIFRDFVNEDKAYRLSSRRCKQDDWTGYVSGEKIYEAYTIDGLKLFKEVTLGCCISNAPFQSVMVGAFYIFITEKNWDKSMSNRKTLKHLGYRVT